LTVKNSRNTIIFEKERQTRQSSGKSENHPTSNTVSFLQFQVKVAKHEACSTDQAKVYLRKKDRLSMEKAHAKL
jgi:hypothetical protein